MLITLDICSTLAHKHMEKDISKKIGLRKWIM